MPIVTRTFRIFASSTFEDLKAERDALQREVFPKLRTLCEQHGARFQAIDLRWGVRDEAALDQQTVEICLRETEAYQRRIRAQSRSIPAPTPQICGQTATRRIPSRDLLLGTNRSAPRYQGA